uniref:Pyrroline-5-carboxylate reductase n=1 Tax=Hirondellea gigas TaxID=1518452 RepID=A0A2P2I897_9CRUS
MSEVFLSKLEARTLQVGFIGAGNMAQAIINSLLKSGMVSENQLTASAPSDTRLCALRKRGIATTHDNDEVVQRCDVVVLCVKPHIFPHMVKKISTGPENCRTKLFISIMAGLPIALVAQYLSCFGAPAIIRATPNTPCLVTEGCCVYAVQDGVNADLSAVGSRLLSVLGLVRCVPEQQIDAAGAVAGSGPAYIYVAIEALADGGVKMGLPRELAQSLAAQTVRGAGTMVLQTGKHPGQLKDEVCSPGGTTIAAIHALEKNGFRNALICAVEAATLRSGELAKQQQTGNK